MNYDDKKDFIMSLFRSAFGIPDVMKLCVLREQVLSSPSSSYHQSHNEIEKALFEGEKEAYGLENVLLFSDRREAFYVNGVNLFLLT